MIVLGIESSCDETGVALYDSENGLLGHLLEMTEGGEIDFRVPPRLNLQDQDVLIVDDIYDIGLTLEMIEDYCHSRHARSVNSAVLVRKIHDRPTTDRPPRFIGMDIEDKYIFGCGMDAYEHWRHLDEIRALEEEA